MCIRDRIKTELDSLPTELDEQQRKIMQMEIEEAALDVYKRQIRNRHNINIMAFKHNGVMNMNIRSDTRIPENNTMLVLGNIKDIQKCFHIWFCLEDLSEIRYHTDRKDLE